MICSVLTGLFTVLLAMACRALLASQPGGCTDAEPKSCLAEGDAGSLLQTRRRAEAAAGEGPPLQAVGAPRVDVAADGRSATVTLEHAGRQLQYMLAARRLFVEGGGATAVKDHGPEALPAARAFAFLEPGRRAAATLHADGTVSGVFEAGGELLRVTPAAWRRRSGMGRGGRGFALVSYEVQQISWADVLRPRRGAEAKGFKEFDWPGINATVIIDEDPTGNWPPRKGQSADGTLTFEGQPFQPPSCFPGDSQRHTFVLDVVGDVPAYNAFGPFLAQMMQDYVNSASIIYAGQMNVELVIGQLTVYTAVSTAPSYARACQGSNFMQRKLYQLQAAWRPFAGATHLFTDCGTNSGVIGIAFLAAISNPAINVAVNQITFGSPSLTWVTFAHELGHNFGARHSFEQGQGTTGGIMDYGNGTLNGVYQFNRKYRRDEFCGMLTLVKTGESSSYQCKSKFSPSSR